MKICFIGFCGHSFDAYRAVKDMQNTEICGYANGSSHETRTSSPMQGVKFYESYKNMLDSEKPDIAVVSPVFGLTAEICTECAERKIDIFAEKPVAGDIESLEKLRRAVKENGVRFLAMHYLRFSDPFYTAAKMVRKGVIGDVVLVNAQKSYKYGQRPEWYKDEKLYTGTVPWVGIHGIDWIYHFSGKRFLSVSTVSDKFSPTLAAASVFELEGSALATLSIDYYRPSGAKTHGDDRVRCVGTKGVIEVRGGEIFLTGESGEEKITAEKAPELFTEFVLGNDLIDADEIFYLCKVALLARDAAKLSEKIRIEDTI